MVKKRLKNVKKQFLREGIVPKQHSNISKPSNDRASEFFKRKQACTFIQNFAENNALVMPGRMTNYKNPDLKLLPSSMSKKYVYELYRDALKETDDEAISLRLWYQTWHELCGNVVVQLPRTDLCSLCQQNQITVGKMRNLDEDKKLGLIKQCQDHLLCVQKEREHYSQVIAHCQSQPLLPRQPGAHTACSFVGTMHQSFDFAQQIHLPYNSQQVGPIYFLTGYKIGLFGVAMEPIKKFVLYIIPEACAVGKGSNVVLSLLHHYFDNFGLGETECMCHADNCSGQNKNNFMMQYALWRVCSGYNQQFSMKFLPVGHTKFWPDLYFGLFKKKLRMSKAETVEDVCKIAVSSCPQSNAIIPIPVGDEHGKLFVPTYDWQNKFEKNMKTIPDLKKYHQFVFSSQSPGTVTCTPMSSDPCSEGTSFTLVKDSTSVTSTLPPEIHPQSLSLERQKYLAEKIRPFVTDDGAKDILCPFPTAAQAAQETGHEAIVGPSSKPDDAVGQLPVAKRKTPVCSYCKMPGHRNQMRNKVPSCPKRKKDEI